MDFLDSLDLDVSYKRSRRVRSWYLYEQFKSLERKQIDATLKLRDRSFQNRVLRQELSERKARRTLYDQPLSVQSGDSLSSRVERSVKSEGADTTSIDKFYASFSELYDSGIAPSVAADDESEPSTVDHLDDDFKSVNEKGNTISCAQSMQSVVYVESVGTITGFKDEDCEQSPHDSRDTVVDEINHYFDELKDNLEHIEKLAEYDFDDKNIETDSVCSVEDELPLVVKDKTICKSNQNINAIWSKLVSFAYQIVQLNHGNCYSDYGSQFLTAVLACDVLRRGINKICDILQPFVCPVKNYASSDSDTCSDCYKREKRKVKHIPKIARYRRTNKFGTKNSIVQITRQHRSENWQVSKNSTENKQKARRDKDRGTSEPSPIRSQKLYSKGNSKSYESSNCPACSNDTSKDLFLRESSRRRYKMLNDMMKISQYFDSILKDIDATMQV